MAQMKIGGDQIDQNTLTLSGVALTPSSVAASGTVTGSNLSGTNTGDQTLNGLLPSQAGNNGKVLGTDGSNTSWVAGGGGSGTVTSVDMSVPSFLSVSGNPVTTSGTLAVSLSGTALPAVNGGTAQTTYTTGDILYASASNTLSKLSVGSTGQVLTVAAGAPSWAAAAGGTSFPIGTILEAPSAPDSNWVACDGSSLTQASYSSLYSAIGHRYMQYVMTQKTIPATLTQSALITFYTGSNFIVVNSGSATGYYSSDAGDTWSSLTLGATYNLNDGFATNGSGIVIHMRQSSSAWYRSTNHGQTWSAITGVSLTNPRGGFNGSNFVVAGGGSQNIIHSTDGTTWTTATSVLPTALPTANGASVFWFNSKWTIMVGLNDTWTTSTSNGSSGWTSNTPGGGTLAPITPPSFSSTKIASGTFGFLDTSLVARRVQTRYANLSNGAPSFYNGIHFVAGVSQSGGSNSSLGYSTSYDGISYDPMNVENTYTVFTGSGFNSGAAIFTNMLCDTVNNKVILPLSLSATTTSNKVILIEPNINAGTHFSLPPLPGFFIKAL